MDIGCESTGKIDDHFVVLRFDSPGYRRSGSCRPCLRHDCIARSNRVRIVLQLFVVLLFILSLRVHRLLLLQWIRVLPFPPSPSNSFHILLWRMRYVRHCSSVPFALEYSLELHVIVVLLHIRRQRRMIERDNSLMSTNRRRDVSRRSW